jgi:teichuronic acid biosynthesis glycosyltransferase TuaG
LNSPATTPLVSVIVPTYQRQDYLIITLKSILAQSHRRLEVLVVSDGDDDETAAAVHSLDDSRAKYLFTDHAGFPAVPRNKGLRHAQGELLAFCDDDDVWYPTKLTQQIPVLADNRFGMCTTDYEFIDPDGGLESLFPFDGFHL